MITTRHHDGFTLIELLACIVILAVLAAIAGPTFFEKQPYSERGYAAEVVAALRGARQIAVASQCDVQVTLNPAAGYRATQPVANCAGAYTTAVRLTDGNLLANTPPAGVALNPAAVIVFGKNGQVVGAAPPTLTVGAFSITIDPISGYVSK